MTSELYARKALHSYLIEILSFMHIMYIIYLYMGYPNTHTYKSVYIYKEWNVWHKTCSTSHIACSLYLYYMWICVDYMCELQHFIAAAHIIQMDRHLYISNSHAHFTRTDKNLNKNKLFTSTQNLYICSFPQCL